MVFITEKAISKTKRNSFVKRMAKSKDVMVLDSDSDDGQIDLDDKFLLAD